MTWTASRIDALDEFLQNGYTLEESARLLRVPYASAEMAFHRILLQSAVAFGESRAVPCLAARYDLSEETVEALLRTENKVARAHYRRFAPWKPMLCDTVWMLAAGLVAGLGSMYLFRGMGGTAVDCAPAVVMMPRAI